MKVLPTSVRPEIIDSEINLGGASPDLFEKSHLKEITMNGTMEPAVVSEKTEELKQNGYSEAEPIKQGEGGEVNSSENGLDSPQMDEQKKENEEPIEKTASSEVEKKNSEEPQMTLISSDEVSEESEKSVVKLSDDASSTSTEDIRLVLDEPLESPSERDEESDDVSLKEAEAKPEPEKTVDAKMPDADEAERPSSPGISEIALDNITSNFDDDSCTSFDKSIEELEAEKEKTEDAAQSEETATKVEEPKEPESTSDAVEIMDVEEIKTKVAEKPNDVARKRLLSDEESSQTIAKKAKPEEIKEEDEIDNKTSIAQELHRNIKKMSRQDLERFLVDAFISNMTRKNHIALQDQELLRMKKKVESYKKAVAQVTNQCNDLKKTMAKIEEVNRTSGKIARPKPMVRNVASQVPSKDMAEALAKGAQAQEKRTGGPAVLKAPEKKIRTLTPVSRPASVSITTSTTTATTPSPVAQARGYVNKTGRPAGNRQVLVPRQPGSNMYSANSPTMVSSMKSPPKTQNIRQLPGSLSTPDGPMSLVQSGNRLIIPNTANAGQVTKTPVAYLISNSKTQPLMMQNGVSGLIMNKQQLQGRSPNSLANQVGMQRQMQAPTQVPGREIMSVTKTWKPMHPAPLPPISPQAIKHGAKLAPPKPSLKIQTASKGIMLSWHLPSFSIRHEEIKSYQIYAYQETAEEPDSKLWKTVGDVKALALPMACTLTQFKEGYKYHFAVRAVDVLNRMGASSDTMSIILQKRTQDSSQTH